ncbi:MAG TPA: hypothetical protein VFM82_07670 [Flavobacteriaceae bacterium]|nr:hypothetical protein [Flavobacteriaceae bacterium]
MYKIVFHLHSYWAYLVVLIVLLATLNALTGAIGKRQFAPRDFRISLFALIVSHIQLLIGLILFFVSPMIQWFTADDIGAIMKDDTLRLYNVEHPLLMIIAVILITIGYSKHKKKLTSAPKFKILSIYYTLALIAILAIIPWEAWF